MKKQICLDCGKETRGEITIFNYQSEPYKIYASKHETKGACKSCMKKKGFKEIRDVQFNEKDFMRKHFNKEFIPIKQVNYFGLGRRK